MNFHFIHSSIENLIMIFHEFFIHEIWMNFNAKKKNVIEGHFTHIKQ
jgi:hypothetical protein